MTNLSPAQTVQRYLEEYGWRYHSNHENCWLTGWQSEKRAYPLIVTLNDSWICFQVAPMLKLGVEWNSWPEIMRYILELNDECRLVKLGIDSFGDISMSLYLFTSYINYEQFSDAIGVIGHYSEKIYDEIHSYLDSIGFHSHRPGQYLA